MKTLILIVLLMLPSCTNEAKARRILEAEGIKQIKITGFRFFICDSKEDWYSTGFRGIKNGREVSGAVCDGLIFKGATIRYD